MFVIQFFPLPALLLVWPLVLLMRPVGPVPLLPADPQLFSAHSPERENEMTLFLASR
jgi:hypothetical protein